MDGFLAFRREFWDEAVVASWTDLGHAVLRSVLIVIFVFAVFRFLGQRSTSQLNIFGLLLVVGLSPAVGDPMFYRDVNLSLTMLAILVVVATFKFMNDLTAQFRMIDRYATPEPVPFIQGGELLPPWRRGSHQCTSRCVSTGPRSRGRR